MISIFKHRQSTAALRVWLVVFCLGINSLGFTTAYAGTDMSDGHAMHLESGSSTPVASHNDQQESTEDHRNHAFSSTAQPTESASEHRQHSNPCTGPCNVEHSCASLCALACASAGASAVAIDMGPILLHAHAMATSLPPRRIDSLVGIPISPLYRPPII